MFGKSNEKYHVRGGNDQIPLRLRDRLPGQITLGRELIATKRPATRTGSPSAASRRRSPRTSSCSRSRSRSCATPSISPGRLLGPQAAGDRRAGHGHPNKLHLQFERRLWSELGSNGETFADTGYLNTWEVSRAQPGTSGILVDYTGGTVGASFGSGSPASRAEQFLEQIEPVLPGLRALEREGDDRFLARRPLGRGSSLIWKVGQYLPSPGSRAGRRATPTSVASTSIDFQGYLNGAVETGERAAAEVIADLR